MKDARQYQKTKQVLSLMHLAYTPLVLALAMLTPLSLRLTELSLGLFSQPVAALAVYFTLFSVYTLLCDLPFSFYAGFTLEKQYKLSNQTLGGWIKDFLKKSILSFALVLPLMLARSITKPVPVAVVTTAEG